MSFLSFPDRPLLIAALACLLVLAACGDAALERERARPVRAVQLTAQDFRAGPAVYPGEIVAHREAALSFQVGGELVERLVDVGDAVREGQPVARLDDADRRLEVSDLRARLAGARARLDNAGTDLARFRDLRERGFISASEFDRADHAVRVARAEVQALQAQLGLAQRRRSYTELAAPYDGVVSAALVDPGQVVAVGQPILQLARDDALEAAFDVPEHSVDHLPETVTVELWAQAGTALSARVREIAAAADPASRTYRVRAALPADADAPRIGMSATVQVAFRQATAGVLLPRSAVFGADDTPRVWRIDGVPAETSAQAQAVTPDATLGHVQPQAVQLGSIDGDRVRVLAGLQPGQWVVTAGVHDLAAGQPVSYYDSEPR